MRILNGPQRIADHQLFNLVADPCTPPHTSCIYQLVGLALPFEWQFDRITGDPGLRPGQQPVLVNQLVDQRGFSHVRAADNGNAHRQGAHLVLPDINRIAILVQRGLYLVIVACIIGAGCRRIKDIDTHCLGSGKNGVMQIDQPLAMHRGNRHRITQPQPPGFGKTAGTGTSLAFVGKHHHMRTRTSNLVGKKLVCRGNADTGINYQKGDVSFVNRTFGLAAHAIFQRPAGRLFKACRIDHPKAQFCKTGIAFAAVTRDPRLIVDNRMLPTDKPVEQRRFADIGSPDNGKRCFHGDHAAFRKDKVNPGLVQPACCPATYRLKNTCSQPPIQRRSTSRCCPKRTSCHRPPAALSRRVRQ